MEIKLNCGELVSLIIVQVGFAREPLAKNSGGCLSFGYNQINQISIGEVYQFDFVTSQ